MSLVFNKSMVMFENIELGADEMQRFAKDERDFGIEWATRCKRQKQAKKYMAEFCEPVEDKCTYAQPYRCCATGSEVYRRKDGLPIRDDDLAALCAIDKGQENSVSLSDSGMEMTHRWLCDSSD